MTEKMTLTQVRDEPVAWQYKRRPEDYADEWKECDKEIFDTIRRTEDSPWVVRELFDHAQPSQAVDVGTAYVQAMAQVHEAKNRAIGNAHNNQQEN